MVKQLLVKARGFFLKSDDLWRKKVFKQPKGRDGNSTTEWGKKKIKRISK